MSKELSLGFLLMKTSRVVSYLYRKELMSINIGAPQSSIILVLNEAGELCQTQISSALNLDKANASDAAKFKRETFERLTRMREGGITIDQIVSASRGNLTDDVVLNILQARKMSISYYRKLAVALDRIES